MNTNTLHTIPDNAKKVRFTYTKQLKNNTTEASERELLLGEEVIIPLLRGGEGWGESNTGNRFVTLYKVIEGEKVGREYLQGVEMDDDDVPHIKRFRAEWITNLQVVNEN